MNQSAAPSQTIDLFELSIRTENFAQAHHSLLNAAKQGSGRPKVVVTPNVDHIVRLDAQAEFKQLYKTADYIYADGMPVVWASRMSSARLPERVTGADLFVSLCRSAVTEKLRVFMLGGMPGQEAELKADFARVYPGLEITLLCPSMKFSTDGDEANEAIRQIIALQPHIVFVCLGMPKQEHFAFRLRKELPDSVHAPVVMCVGAAMEFALNKKKRAPLWMQKIGFEWLWRLLSEPRRLWQRYTVQGSKYGGILLRERKRQQALRQQ